jgi:RND family efflux transporter MFP subunit
MVGTANLGLQDTSLLAPFTAALVQRSVELGSLVSPGAAAFVLADIGSIKASFGVPDSVVIRLKPGARLSVFAEALPETNFQGIVNSIAAVADSNTRLFQVEVSIQNEKGLLRPGMIATLSLGGAARVEPVPVVPLNAVIRAKEGNGAFAVFVVEGKQARRKNVALGVTYGDRVAVTGLTAGEQVISTGATLVTDGDAVEVIP